MNITQRNKLRTKQDRIIEIATERGMPFDVSISEVQLGSPTVLQLHSTILPEYEPSIDSFLRTFESKSQPSIFTKPPTQKEHNNK